MVGVSFDEIRRIALELPSAEEVLTWGIDATFRVNGKMFVVSAPEASHATVKASPDEQAALVAEDPETYSIAPYTGRFGWVRVTLSRVEPDEIRELVVAAWRSTAPKKLVASYDAGTGS
ncbi:MAG: MmcQ/YjbR family DNA-binding protein [Actinocatenispora sp.]